MDGPGSDAGGARAAAAYTLIETAKLNGLDPEAYLHEGARPHRRSPNQSHRRTAALEHRDGWVASRRRLTGRLQVKQKEP